MITTRAPDGANKEKKKKQCAPLHEGTIILVAQPTRWSPIVIWVFVGQSSSWPWEPHIRGCKLFKPVLRTQMAVFDPIFCKMYLLYRSCPRRKSFSSNFCLFPSQNDCFLQPLEGKDWDRTPNQDFTIIPVWGSARVNPKLGLLIWGSVSVFVRWLIWHHEGYNGNRVSPTNTHMIKKILPRKFLALLTACRHL